MSHINVSVSVSRNNSSISADQSVGSQTVFKVDKFTGNGSTTVFALSYRRRANSLSVYKNGILCEVAVDYTEAVNGQSITFVTAPLTGDKIECRYAKG